MIKTVYLFISERCLRRSFNARNGGGLTIQQRKSNRCKVSHDIIGSDISIKSLKRKT